MFDNFYNDMINFTNENENQNPDGSVNWNFVDSDMFEKYQVILDGETYSEYFDKAADIVESAV
jgi:hypothetical protein